MNRLLIFIISLFFLSNCSLNENSRIWKEKEKNPVNNYIDNYRSHELDLKVTNNLVEINFSKYGLLTLNNSA